MTKRKSQLVHDPLDMYGMGNHIKALITGKTETIPNHLNWMELGNLHFYAEHLRPQLTPWIDKMQQHFADEDSECALIIALAKSQEELKLLLLKEIVYIRKLLSIHDFWSLSALLPKLKGENRTLALKTMRKFIDALPEDNIDSRLSCLCEYYDVCTGKKQKAEIQEQIIQAAIKLGRTSQFCNIYKKFPDQRIADLWLAKLKNETDFTTLVNVAIITKQDAFFERAKPEKIIGVESDIVHMLEEKYETCKDERFIDLWLHTLNTFQKKEGSNTVQYFLKAYERTKDVRFMDAVKPYLKHYSDKLHFYALLPTPDMLDTLSADCNSFIDAKDALLITGDRDFLYKALHMIGQYARTGLGNIINVYNELMKDPKKHKLNIKELKDFIEEHIDELWRTCEVTSDKEKFLEITW